MNKNLRRASVAVVALVTLSLLSGCAALSNWGESFARAWKGVSATLTTYDEDSQVMDRVHGTSFAITRDTRFDTSNSEGSNQDSQVLLISVGSSHISHVGSSLVLAQDGLTDVMDEGNARVSLNNSDPGTPWLNNLIESHRNLWQGKGKTILIRSQNGTPLAVYAGSEVEIFKTEVPKSTQFRVDGKYLFVYRADYTVYDTELLLGQ